MQGETMTSRTRLLSVFKQQDVDRVPVAPFIHVNFVKEFFGSDEIDIIAKTIDVYEHFGLDIIHRNCTPGGNDIEIAGSGWEVEKTVEKQGRDEVTTTVVHTPKGDLKQVHKLAWMTRYDAEASPLEYVIKSEKDFELLQEYQPSVAAIDTTGIKKAKELLGDKGITAPWVQGAFNHVAFFFRKLDDLIMDAMINPTFYDRMMEYFLQRNKQIISQYIESGVDALSYAGNIASGKLVGPDFFEKHVAPYEKRLIEFIKSRGVFVQYHNCGYAKKLLPLYGDLGMNVYESLTPPPYGDTTLEEAFDKMPSSITLSGNIDQITFLKTAKPQEIKARVEEVLEKAKERRNFILSTTDYFLEGTPWENILAFAEAGRQFGIYN